MVRLMVVHLFISNSNMKKYLFAPIVFIITIGLPTLLAFCLPSNPTQYYNAYVAKQARWDTLRQPRLMLVGFSELAFGIDSKMIQDSTGYNVCNFGLHAGLGAHIVYDDAVRNASTNDLVILAVPIDMTNSGDAEVASLGYLVDRCPYKLWDLNTSNKMVLIKGVYKLLKGKLYYNVNNLVGKTIFDEEYNCENFNEYGDESAHWYKPDLEDDPDGIKNLQISKLNKDSYEYFVQTVKKIKEKGANVIIIPELLKESTYSSNSEFEDFIEEKLKSDGITYSIRPSNFLLPHEYSYLGVHANRKGVDFVTNKLINAINTTYPLYE